MSKRKYTNWDEIPIVLSTQEVADALGVHVNTVKSMVAEDKLPYFRVGRVLKFNKVDVMRFAGMLPDQD